MIGKICWAVFPYYDSKLNKNAFKKRPVLIIGDARNNDYTVLPISTVTRKANLDDVYDIEIDVVKYQKLCLPKNCYVRSHKQTIVHKASVTSCIGNMKTDYPDLFLLVMQKWEQFNNYVLEKAL